MLIFMQLARVVVPNRVGHMADSCFEEPIELSELVISAENSLWLICDFNDS